MSASIPFALLDLGLVRCSVARALFSLMSIQSATSFCSSFSLWLCRRCYGKVST